jgi:DNA-binding NtrC family response regulator
MVLGRVLVIDDEPVIRWAIEQTLQAAGYEVAVAGTAAEGLRLFQALDPQVIFLDVRLPDESGLTVLERIKQAHKDSAVIVMTAFTESAPPAEAKRLGAYDYLGKPFEFDGLPALVSRALASGAGQVGH